MSDLRNLLAAATPGPWKAESGTVWGGFWRDHEGEYDADLCADMSVADAALVVSLRNQAEALLELVEAAKWLRESSKQTDAIENEWSYGPVVYCDPGAYFALADALSRLAATEPQPEQGGNRVA